MSDSQKRHLSCQINLGLTGAEAAVIDTARARAGISRAAFARRAVLSAVGQPDTTRARRSTALPPSDVAAVAALTGAVGRATGATVQLAKTLRTIAPGSRQHAESESVLLALRTHAEALARIVERLK